MHYDYTLDNFEFDLDIKSFDLLSSEFNSLTPKMKSSVKRIVSLLCSRGHQYSEFKYVELSVGYAQFNMDYSYETCRKAWNWLKNRVGFICTHIEVIRALGYKIRDRKKGLWGQHLLLHDESKKILSRLAKSLGIKVSVRSWKEVDVERRGFKSMCRCPFHDDNEPSMILNKFGEEGHGSAYCFGCKKTGFWKSEGSKVMVSEAVNKGRPSSFTKNLDNIETSITELNVNLSDLREQTLRYRIHPDQSRRDVVSKTLPETLRMMNKRCSDKHWGRSVSELHQTGSITDVYLTVDRMKPSKYKKIVTGGKDQYIPSKWSPVYSEYLLVDLDGFDGYPLTTDGIGQEMDKVSRSSDLLDEGCIVIRTSMSGLQILFKLKDPKPCQSNWMIEFKSEIDKVDQLCLDASHRCGFVGGHPDKSAHSCGRNMRSPGYRIDKKGSIFRSSIVFDSMN